MVSRRSRVWLCGASHISPLLPVVATISTRISHPFHCSFWPFQFLPKPQAKSREMGDKPADECGYVSLKDPEREVGLAKLLSSHSLDANLRIGFLRQRSLTEQTRETRVGLIKAQSTPMPGWTALLDLEGRYIFKAAGGRRVAREHPDASVDPPLYEVMPQPSYSQALCEVISYS